MGRKKVNRIYSMFTYDEENKKSKCLMEGCNATIKVSGFLYSNLYKYIIILCRVT